MGRYERNPVLAYFERHKFGTATMCAAKLRYTNKQVAVEIRNLGGKIRIVSRKRRNSDIYVLQDYNRVDNRIKADRLERIKNFHQAFLLEREVATFSEADYVEDVKENEPDEIVYQSDESDEETQHRNAKKLGRKGGIRDIIEE